VRTLARDIASGNYASQLACAHLPSWAPDGLCGQTGTKNPRFVGSVLVGEVFIGVQLEILQHNEGEVEPGQSSEGKEFECWKTATEHSTSSN
jgi:hypothetical protein